MKISVYPNVMDIPAVAVITSRIDASLKCIEEHLSKIVYKV